MHGERTSHCSTSAATLRFIVLPPPYQATYPEQRLLTYAWRIRCCCAERESMHFPEVRSELDRSPQCKRSGAHRWRLTTGISPQLTRRSRLRLCLIQTMPERVCGLVRRWRGADCHCEY